MMMQTASLDLVMRALADPTRRAVFERVARSREITVVELTRGSGVTQGAISQHLKSLKQAGLVAERPEGRNVFYRAEPEGLAPLVASEIWRIVRELRQGGLAVIIVDKNFATVSTLTDRAILLVKGRIVFDDNGAELRRQAEILRQHLGI